MKTIKLGVFCLLAFYLKKTESTLNLRTFSKNTEISEQLSNNKINPDNLILVQLEADKKLHTPISSDPKVSCKTTAKKSNTCGVEINLNLDYQKTSETCPTCAKCPILDEDEIDVCVTKCKQN